jgi:hypothetical protein
MAKSRDRSSTPVLATATVRGWEVLAASLPLLSQDVTNKVVMTSASMLIVDVTNLGIGFLLLVAEVGQHPWFFIRRLAIIS